MRYAVALLLLGLFGCRGIVIWGTVYSAASRDGSAQVLVQEKGCFADCAVQIVVKRGWHSEQIAWRSDCYITFAHAEWLGDVVAVFVDGTYCGQIRVAYDSRLRRSIDFKSAEDRLRSSIVRAYNVTAQELDANSGDVFRWATYPGDGNPRRSKDEFHKRYPGP
jgi:hypothetical protein